MAMGTCQWSGVEMHTASIPGSASSSRKSAYSRQPSCRTSHPPSPAPSAAGWRTRRRPRRSARRRVLQEVVEVVAEPVHAHSDEAHRDPPRRRDRPVRAQHARGHDQRRRARQQREGGSAGHRGGRAGHGSSGARFPIGPARPGIIQGTAQTRCRRAGNRIRFSRTKARRHGEVVGHENASSRNKSLNILDFSPERTNRPSCLRGFVRKPPPDVHQSCAKPGHGACGCAQKRESPSLVSGDRNQPTKIVPATGIPAHRHGEDWTGWIGAAHLDDHTPLPLPFAR
jgi:hypothetical protein